jgi:hypothetical protein
MLRKAYPYYLANKPVFANEDQNLANYYFMWDFNHLALAL